MSLSLIEKSIEILILKVKLADLTYPTSLHTCLSCILDHNDFLSYCDVKKACWYRDFDIK